MGAIVHPSQRRLSCETCRKHKSRCHRLYPNDPKCTRCIILDVQCTTGQQKKVGRPRRVAGSGSEATRDSTASRPSINNLPAAHVEDTSSHPAAFLEATNELSWKNMSSWAPTPVSILVTTPYDEFSAETWPSVGMDPLELPLQTAAEGAVSWDAPNYPVESGSSSTTTTNSALGMTTPLTHSFHAPLTEVTASSPADSISTEANVLRLPAPTQAAVDGIAASEAIAKLSKINLDLHLRMAAAESNRAVLNFNDIIHRGRCLCIDNFTLAEFLLGTSQRFLLILTRLRANRSTYGLLCATQRTRSTTCYPELFPMSSQMDVFAQDRLSEPSGFSQPSVSQHQSNPTSSQYNSSSVPASYHVAASELLLAPIALTITSIFIQLIYLHELTLTHMTARIEVIDTDPIPPIPGLTFGGLPIAEPCTQGILFSEVVVHLLERIEQALGIGVVPEGGGAGLLSPRQIDVLWSEFDERVGSIRGRGMMRPANMRASFKNVGKMLKQLSLN